jgi:hypothetical protein
MADVTTDSSRADTLLRLMKAFAAEHPLGTALRSALDSAIGRMEVAVELVEKAARPPPRVDH